MPHLEDPLLQAYIDGYCNESRVAEIEAHLETCDECRARFEAAQQAASKASQLLGALEPGPVHAPAFEELEARAAERAEGEVPVDVAVKLAEAAVPKTTPASRPLWSSPKLAWAATLAIAFMLGWLSRSEIGMPALQAPEPSFERGLADAEPRLPSASTPAEQGRIEGELDDLAVAEGGIVASSDAPDAQVLDALQAQVGDEAANRAAGAGVSSAVEELRAEQQVAAAKASDAPGRRAAEAPAAAAPVTEPPAQQPAAVTVTEAEEARAVPEANEELAQVGLLDDAAIVGNYVPIDASDVAAWLGAPSREVPDLTLVRAEVGPGTLVAEGLPERPAVRLTYLSENGEEIALVQQFLGPVGGPLGPGDYRADAGAGGDRESELRRRQMSLRANREAGADRDAVVGGAFAEAAERKLISDPNGPDSYQWIDQDGYFLVLTADIDPTILRGLADRIR